MRDEIIDILESVRRNQSELSYIDCKETLNLKEPGDRAFFIKHVAALANTGRKAHLLLGIENKTWKSVGIPPDSPLANIDATQQQMNQILSGRADPPLQIRYATVIENGLLIGAVNIDSKHPPYVISISDVSYGGTRTKGEDSYIYRGAIYIRRGTDSVIANRQSEILALVEGKPDFVNVIISLVFIGVLVGSGVGLGASIWSFGDPYVAALFSSLWGLFVGYLLHERVIKGIGFVSVSTLGKTVKNLLGPIWGALIGALLGYLLVNSILDNETQVLHPVIMALIAGPLGAFILMVSIAGYSAVTHVVITWFKKLRRPS